MEKIAEFLSGIKNLVGVRVLPYHNYAGSKYASLGMENTLPSRVPTDEEMAAAKEIFKSFGIKVI
jgi:pyruvate-formate lyase-activating enzyme